MKFYRLANGARFKSRGLLFTKCCGTDSTQNKRGWVYIIIQLPVVQPEGEPMLLPPEEPADWKPNYGLWTEFMERVAKGGGGRATFF